MKIDSHCLRQKDSPMSADYSDVKNVHKFAARSSRADRCEISEFLRCNYVGNGLKYDHSHYSVALYLSLT